jgi:8-oxo-dGTP diphosphatase
VRPPVEERDRAIPVARLPRGIRGTDGEARVADAEELDAITWAQHSELPGLVPYGLFEPVQEYLDETLPH